MTDQTPVHNVTSIPETPVDPTVVEATVTETAPRFVRTKAFAKTTLARVGVPVAIGVAAAFVATRKSDKHLEIEGSIEDDNVITDETPNE